MGKSALEISGQGNSLLLIGYSRIARKRIIPALIASGKVRCLDIASRSSSDRARAEQQINGQVFESYSKALEASSADIVYISLINSLHGEWAEKALLRGRNVILDKPAFSSYAEAKKLVGLAQAHNLLLAEAITFPFHPQVDIVRDEFRKAGSYPTRVTALFSFPPLQKSDFRYRKECGGGALKYLGPYAISAGRVFLCEYPRTIYCQINERIENETDISFSMTAVFSEGKSMVGHFGFTTEYQNFVSILGPSLCIRADRVFTVPGDYSNVLDVRHSDKIKAVTVPPGDCFLNFFEYIFQAYSSGQFDSLYQDLLKQAESLDLLKHSAKEIQDW